MDESLRAFSFIDQILLCEAGVMIRGRYQIPAGIDAFPSSLVAEAVGQLAACCAMAVVDFQRRPVAGIAGRIDLLGEVRPGQTLDLAADLESADAEAVGYCGSASVDGIAVLRLSNCVGPMVTMDEFDDPIAVRSRFNMLCGEGAGPGGFDGLPPLPVKRTVSEVGKIARGVLSVPASARIFADHFPRRPVFPGSLLMHSSIELAAQLVSEISPASAERSWRPRAVCDMKLRAFIPPGEVLELEARLKESSDDMAELVVETRQGKRLLGSARVTFASEGLL